MSSQVQPPSGGGGRDEMDTLESIMNPTFEDSSWSSKNRERDSKLERLRDRVTFGENLERVIQLDGTECPWTQGVEPAGTEDNPEGDENRLRTMWRNVDRKGFQECNARRSEEGDPSYNKVFGNINDSNPRYLKTRHKTLPYCVRCEVPKTVKQDYAEMVKTIENLADTITESRRSKAYEKRARLMEELENKKEEWNKLYDQIYWGKDVSHFRVPASGCMDSEATANLWQDPNKLKNLHSDDIQDVVDSDGNVRKVWRREFAVKDPTSGRYYCARKDDPNVLQDPHYHDLGELDRVRLGPGSDSWPHDPDTDKPLSVAEVYNRAAFCSQLSQPGRAGETMCRQGSQTAAPLGQTLVPSEMCKWVPNYTTGGECVEKHVLTDKHGTVQKDTPYGKWYAKFAKKERSMAANPTNATSDFPKQRFMMPYTVPLPAGGGAKKAIEAGGKKKKKKSASKE